MTSISVLHVITGLGNGGAENQLLRLIEESGSEQDHVIVHLGGSNRLSSEFERASKSLVGLNITGLWSSLFAIYRLASLIRSLKPDVVQGWLPHGNLIATFSSILAGNPNLFWNVRSSGYAASKSSRQTSKIVKVLARLSHFAPRKIISCGPAATGAHIDLGFCESKFINIPNGYAMPTRHSRKAQQKKFRTEHSIPTKRVLIGMVARYHELKDHSTLFRAIALTRHEHPNFQLVLAGRGMVWANSELKEKIEEAGIQDLVTLLGEVGTGDELYQVLDLHVLSSCSEGFPNVIAESMLHEVPNIATEVGEAAQIIGNQRWIVPIRCATSLSAKILEFLNLSQEEAVALGLEQSDRIRDNFSIESCLSSYKSVWESKAVNAFLRYSELGASSRIRWLQYEKHLGQYGWLPNSFSFVSSRMLENRYRAGWRLSKDLINAYITRAMQLIWDRNYDTLWIQRELFPYVPWFIEKAFIPKRKWLVVDFDDAVYLVYESSKNPLVRFFLVGKINGMCRRADVVSVGSPELKKALTTRGAKRIELINSVASATVSGVRSKSTRADDTLVVGWIGSPSTWASYGHLHLDYLEPILEKLNLEFHVFGGNLEQSASGRISFFEWSLEAERSILASIDIGVMFLKDDDWSRAKCAYKILLYFSAGIPVLASNIGYNRDVIKHGKNGFLVDSREECEHYLSQLRKSRKLRDEMSEANIALSQSAYSFNTALSQLNSVLNPLENE